MEIAVGVFSGSLGASRGKQEKKTKDEVNTRVISYSQCTLRLRVGYNNGSLPLGTMISKESPSLRWHQYTTGPKSEVAISQLVGAALSSELNL